MHVSQPDALMLRKAESPLPTSAGTIPTEIAGPAMRRLQIVALAMALGVFVLSFVMPAVTGKLEQEFSSLIRWLPDAINIVVSLSVFALARSSRVSAGTTLNIGLAYQVAAGAFMSLALYGSVVRAITTWNHWYEWLGPGWVAVWMIFFAILVPARPAKALVASLATAATVPTTVAFTSWHSGVALPSNLAFFEVWVLPYLIVVATAFFANLVLYRMGTEIRQARELGSYQLEKKLGAGGMGEVWRARHRMLARPAAIKLMRPEVLERTQSSDEAHARFTREAEATAELQSPHTVQLYDFGVSADGQLYYVMELLDGIDLESFVQRYGPMPQERVVHVLVQACASLGEAHEHGLIHRDIKPANLVLTQFALQRDFVKILDFGLVKRETGLSGEVTTLSQTGQITGTPAYMAPELAVCDEIDHRADLYALGCTAYWLLTGKPMFNETSAMKMIMAHVTEQPEPLCEVMAEPPLPELESLITSCLEKHRDDRPASAAELAERLAELPLPERWTQARADAWWSAHPMMPDEVHPIVVDGPGADPSAPTELGPKRLELVLDDSAESGVHAKIA